METCLLASTKPLDIVIDPFLGSGTTGLVSANLERRFIGCDLNPDYIQIAKRKIMKNIHVNLIVCSLGRLGKAYRWGMG